MTKLLIFWPTDQKVSVRIGFKHEHKETLKKIDLMDKNDTPLLFACFRFQFVKT